MKGGPRLGREHRRGTDRPRRRISDRRHSDTTSPKSGSDIRPTRSADIHFSSFQTRFEAERAGLTENLVHDFAEVAIETFATGYFQLASVEAELVEHCRVQVGHVVTVLCRVKTEFVRRSVDDTRLDSAASHYDVEAVQMVVSPGRFGRCAASTDFGTRRSAEFRADDDQRLVEQTSLLQVLDQSGNRLIHLLCKF